MVVVQSNVKISWTSLAGLEGVGSGPCSLCCRMYSRFLLLFSLFMFFTRQRAGYQLHYEVLFFLTQVMLRSAVPCTGVHHMLFAVQ